MKRIISLSMVTILLVMTLAFPAVAWNDGVYSGEAAGHNGPIALEVTVEKNKITDITIVSHSETPYLSDAGFAVTETIINKQSYIVDSVTGATVTSDAVMVAIREALLVPDGTYVGTGAGYNGDITVQVVVKDREITEITILSHSDTPGLSDAAFNALPPLIYKSQSPVVDMVTGATATSKGFLEAVRDALTFEK